MNLDEPGSIPPARGRADAWLSFLGRRLSPSFERRAVTIAAHRTCRVDGGAWRDAIVIVERGSVELECLHGGRGRFARGDVLWLSGRDPRALHNRGEEPAVLVAIARRRGADVEARTERLRGDATARRSPSAASPERS